MISFYETKDLIDTSIPITDGNTTAWRWIHRLPLPLLYKGDILQVTASCEIRSDVSYNVEVVTAITLCPGYPYYSEDLWGAYGAPGAGYWISEMKGENVDPIRHYRSPDIMAQFKMPADMAGGILHLRGRARSAVGSGGSMSVMGPGYGRMSCTILQP